MNYMRALVVLSTLFFSLPNFAYRIEAGDLYVGGGLGMNVNVARMETPSLTPGFELPFVGSVDYHWDANWSFFGMVIPSFAVNNLGLGIRAGAKYWFTGFDFPLFPYASFALAPSYGINFKEANHFNLGFSPGIGAGYFIVAKFMVGAHLHMNPSIAWAGGERKFEFGVMPFFDLSLRL